MGRGKQRKRLLITGASGLLGGNLAYCLRDDYEICGLYWDHEVKMDKVIMRQCDLRLNSQAGKIVRDFSPDIIIHCAAQANVDVCEEYSDQAEQLNIAVTKNIAGALTGRPVKLIYISTDLVYDGTKGNYAEDDPVGPLNVYGRSKLKGEQEALKVAGALVLRTNFFGWNVYENKSLGEWVVNELSFNHKIKGFTDAYFSSIYTFDLAELIDQAIKKDISGIYNFGSSSSLSKHDFAAMIANKLGLNTELIIPASIDDFNFKAKRSKDLSLNVNKLSKSLGTKVPTLEASVDHFIGDYQKGAALTFWSHRCQQDIYPKLDYLPYGRQSIDEDDIRAVVSVLKSGNLTQGPKITDFERKLREQTGSLYAVAVNSGTSALHIACLAAGVKPGNEAVTSPNSFVASANCIVYCGGTPVFADIDPKTYNISPKELEQKITANTKAVIPVHFAGQSCDMEAIAKIIQAKEKQYGHKIYVIEDAAHALGSRYKNHVVGSCHYSDMVIMSFHPVKHITTGEGGMVLTNNEDLYKKLSCFRSHGITNRPEEFLNTSFAFSGKGEGSYPWYYEQQILGHNYRMTDIQCALGISQMNKLSAFIKKRRDIVDYYNQQFKGLQGVQIPFESPDCDSNFHLYVLLFDFLKIGKTRTWCMEGLQQQGIRTQVHYIPIVLQPFYKEKFKTDLDNYPKVKDYYDQCLSIPLYPGMTDKDAARVVDCVKRLIS